MNTLKDFVVEYRTAGSKNKGKVVDVEDVDLKKVDKVANNGKLYPTDKFDNVRKGEYASKNGTKGVWELDVHTPEDEVRWSSMVPGQMTKNKRKVASRFQGDGSDFLAVGDAGWAKTALITDIAKSAGYDILTVYLDKAIPSDLGGIPVPVRDDESGHLYLEYGIPSWAEQIILTQQKNPNAKILLFFDEMNQAEPGVLNALMPIVLRHVICGIHFDNIIVGAAGNESKQNDSINEISQPLRDRFKPIIYWETHTDETWNEAFDYAHKVWDPIIGEEAINKVEEMKEYWNSPRDIERQIYQFIKNHKGKCFEDPEDIADDRLRQALWDELDEDVKNSRELSARLKKLAQWIYDYCNGNATEENSRKRSKSNIQVDAEMEEAVKTALINGYVQMEGKKYVCTVENALKDVFDPEETGVTAEVLNKIIKKIEADGKSPKFKTNADYEESGKKYLNPAESN